MQLMKWAFTLTVFGSALACESRATPVAPPGGVPTPTPSSRATITGTVSEIGAGPIAGARVLAEGGGQSTTSSADGTFSLPAIPLPSTIRFSAVGFEEMRLRVTAEHLVVNASMRRGLVIGVDSSLTVSLSPSDPGEADTQFGHSWCEPCKSIRIQADSTGETDVTVRWTSTAFLALWDPQSRGFAYSPTGGAPDGSSFTARVKTKVGETIIYVGVGAYLGPPLVEPMQFEVVTKGR